MTDPTPIYTAIQIMRTAVADATGAHWQRNEDADPVLPYLFFHSQDDGGIIIPTIGSRAWSGLITLMAVANYQDEAESALDDIPAAMNNLAAPDGYTIRAEYRGAKSPPPQNETRYSAQVWEVSIEREP